MKKLGGLLGLMAGAASVMPEEADAAVYSKDGRRLLNLLDNASKGALPMNEPVFEFQERLPRDIFKAAKEDNGAFHTRKFAADRNDIQHYWNARRGHMSNEEIEDLVESLTTGQDRFYVRANKPYAESVGALGSSTGGRGALRPSEEFTYLHQVNPLSNKRLLKMKRRSWETPDGSAFHPDTSHSPEGGATQRAFSADGVSDDFNIPGMDALRKGMLSLFVGGGAAAALLPDEAEAARPKYMEELVEKLKTGDFTPMDFGRISGGQLKKLQKVDSAFTEGPLKLSGKNIEKFVRKRMGLDHIEPETLVDGLNSVFHGSRSRAFPDGRGAAKLFTPDGEYAWRGVVAPHDGFSGLVTGYRYPVEDMKKELSLPSEGRPLPSYPHIPEEVASKEGTLPGRLTTVEDKEKLFGTSNIPGMDALRKGMLPLFAGGGAAAAFLPDEAEASVSAEQYRFPADEPGYVNREPGLGTPLVDVADFLTAPIGAATTAGRMAAVAAEPFVAYGMDRAGNWLGNRMSGLLDYFMGGE